MAADDLLDRGRDVLKAQVPVVAGFVPPVNGVADPDGQPGPYGDHLQPAVTVAVNATDATGRQRGVQDLAAASRAVQRRVVIHFCGTLFLVTAIPIRELSHHTARCMALVKAGETVDITERGKIIGRIVPVDPVHDARARLIAEGRIRPATAGRAALLTAIRRRSATEPVDAESRGTAALLEMRDDERY